MAIELDELITKLSYLDNSKTLEEADKRVEELDKSNEGLAKSTDLVSQKQLKLAQQIQTSKERTDELRAKQLSLRSAMKAAGGGTDEQRKKLKQLNVQVDASQLKTKKLQTQSKRLGLEKRKLSQETKKLTRAQKRLEGAVERTTRSVKKETSSLGRFGKRVATIVSGLAIRDFGKDIIRVFTEAARAVAELVPEFAAVGDQIGKTSKALGISSDDLQRLRFAGERSGVSIQQMDKSLGTLTKNLEDARQKGTGPAADAFETLGLSATNFTNLGTERRVALIADAFNKLENPVQQSAVAMQLFGSKNKEFGNLLREGSTGIKELGDRAQELGGVIDADAVVAAERLTDQFLDLKTFAGGLKNELATGLAPFVEQLNVGMLNWIDNNQELLGQGLDVALKAITRVAELLGEAVAAIPLEKLLELFESIVEIVGTVAETFVSAATEGGGLGSTMFELVVAFFDLVAAATALISSIGAVGDELDDLPGIFDLVLVPIGLAIDGLLLMVKALTELLRMLDPVIDSLKDFAANLPEFTLFDGVSSGIDSMAVSLGIFNNELDDTTIKASDAFAAILKLTDAQAPKEKAAEGVKGVQTSEANIRKRKENEQKKDAANAEATRQDKTVRSKLGKKSTSELKRISKDSSLSEDTRKAASKLLKKRNKSGSKSAKDERKGLLTVKIEQQIQARANEAGERAAARELIRARRAKETVNEGAVNQIQRDERERVKKQLTTRFAETGELPAGIRSDISQISKTPGIEAAGGQVAPPVISIQNFRITGTTITLETNIASTGATAEQIAAANSSMIRGLSQRDVGQAILNSATNERR